LLFTTWSGFAYLQTIMLWMSSVFLVAYAITGGVGLILHLFTNMFMVTAIVGVCTTLYLQYTFVAGIIAQVHTEVHHAQVIMDDLVTALGKRLMHLRLKKVTKREDPVKAAAQKKKISRIQKAILMVQSAFSNCVTHELHAHGFGPKEFLIQLTVALTGAAVIILIVYSGMKAAHAFGKAVQAAGSALAGGAFAIMNASKEQPKTKGKAPKFPPKIQLAIDGLNEALQITVKDSVSDLVYMLKHEHHCMDIVSAAIDEAEAEMNGEKEDPWAAKNAATFIKVAKDGLKDGKKKVKIWLKERSAKEAAAAEHAQ